MRKNLKTPRLTLSRETLLHLENERIATVAGGESGRPICCTASGSCPPPPSAESNCC
ncbi:MAG: hypothetical protein ACJ75H_12005 [Thermoanaerobaculia bacterium]